MMIIWAAAATAGCVILSIFLFTIARQIDRICRCLDFIKAHKTNMKIPSDTPLKSINGLIDSINGLLSDTAGERQAVERADRNLRESLTGISHDIRTPLTSLSGYLQLLPETDDPAEKEKYLHIMRARVRDLEEMLENLFSYTKLQNGDYHLQMGPVNFTQCVIDTVLAFYGQLSEQGITPRMDIDESPAYISGNAEALHRILQNILKNALVHGAGDLSVSLHSQRQHAAPTHPCADPPAGHQYVIFTCSNRCEAPDLIDMSGIFTKFYKADPARSDTSTGLGLTIARELADRLDGILEAALEGDVFSIRAIFPLLQDL